MLLIMGCDSAVPNAGSNVVDFVAHPASQSKPADSSLETEKLRGELDSVIGSAFKNRQLASDRNAAWQIMHGVLCFGQELLLETPDRGTISAVEYAFGGGTFQGWELSAGEVLTATGRAGVKAKLEPGSFIGQGHVDQWLAIFAMANLPVNTPVKVSGDSYTINDWVRNAQWECSSNPLREYSWTLIGLTHYLPNEPTWTARDGKVWSWEKMVEQEVVYDLTLSPCGGTHRLMGLVLALQAKRRLGLPQSAIWDKADSVVSESIRTIRSMQNPDGSLSSHYLARPGTTADLSLMLGSTGHLLEFLSVVLPREELAMPWMELAAHRVCEILQVTESVDLDCGALYHAVRGIKLYRSNRFGVENTSVGSSQPIANASRR